MITINKDDNDQNNYSVDYPLIGVNYGEYSPQMLSNEK